MKLTETIRNAFVKAVMQDVPYVDYNEKAREIIQKDAVKKLPTEIKKIWEAPSLKGFIETHTAYVGNFRANIPDGRNYRPSKSVETTLSSLWEKSKAQSNKRRELEIKLDGIVKSCSTRKQLAEALPEFEKYLPPIGEKTRNLPAIANVVSDFVKAGWPNGRAK